MNKNEMIVITGASDGLGLEVAKLYQEEGYFVVNVSRTKSKFADIDVLSSIREGEQIEQIANQIIGINKKLKFYVNCAGVFSDQKFGNITESEIKRLMSTNLKPAILITSFLKEKIEKDETDILNVISTIAQKSNPEEIVYGASKWALRSFTKNLQQHFKDKPNRVVSFCPGGMNTNFFSKEELNNNIDSKKFMNPKDIAIILKQILDLPKSLEVSEIIINRKK